MLSFFAVDLDAVTRAAARPLAEHVEHHPQGRVAVLLQGTAAGRAIFDALLDDLAVAAVHDVPRRAATELLAALARAEKHRAFELSAVDAAPSVYPIDVRPKEPAGMVTFLADAPRAASAARAVRGLPAARGVDEALWQDLVEAFGRLFEAASSVKRVVVVDPA